MATSGDDSFYTKLSNFEIEKKIGKGQFSIVYRARCLANDKVVALKKIQVSTKWYLSHVIPILTSRDWRIRRKIQSFVSWLARCFSVMPYFNPKFTWLIIPVETKSTQDVLWKLMCKYRAGIDSRPVVILLRQPCLVEFILICCGNCPIQRQILLKLDWLEFYLGFFEAKRFDYNYSTDEDELIALPLHNK